jgi:hypothetical protein
MVRRSFDQRPVYAVRMSPSMVGAILATAMALLVLTDIGGLIAKYSFGHPGVLGLVDLFDLDSEENIPSWYSASVLLICLGTLALIAAAKHQAGDRFRWHWGRTRGGVSLFVS